MSLRKGLLRLIFVVLLCVIVLSHSIHPQSSERRDSSHGSHLSYPHSSSHTGSSGNDDDNGGDGSNSGHNGCPNCRCDEYTKVINFRHSSDCTDENRIFPLLKALNGKSHSCRKHAIDVLARTYAKVTDTPSSCQCSGHNDFHKYSTSSIDVPFFCFPDVNFDELYKHFFYHLGLPDEPPKCRSHHAMWSELAKVSSTEYHSSSTSCQQILIEHIAGLFQRSHPCSCRHADPRQTHATPTTTKPTPTTVKTTARPTVAHATTLNQQLSVKFHCGKLSTVETIAVAEHVTQQDATACSPSNGHGTDESFVLINCNTPNPSHWKQGVNVMQHCKEIPTYTPIATFIGGQYYPSLAESGVFMGCIQDGFKLGVQHCNATPTIDHVLTSSTGLQNADVFYVID